MSKTHSKKVSVVQISDNDLKIRYFSDDNCLETDNGPRFGSRHVQALLLSLGLMCGIGTRTNLSVAIVAMTSNNTSPNPDVPTYDWNNTSVLLSSFFWSYITLQIVAGYLGKTYGPKYFLLVALTINFCACALTPLAAQRLGSNGILLIRIIQGFGQGFLFPSVNVLLGRWAPEEERTTISNIALSGQALGTIYSSLITGYVSSSWWGWPASFYILSGMGFCWCIIWFFFGQNSPASHPTISAKERQYIQTSLNQEDDVDLKVPWKEIFTCVPFYALILGSVGYSWGYAVLMTETPTYLSSVMNIDMESNAVLNSVLTAVALICCSIVGPLSDWIISKKFLSTFNARRIFNLIGCFGQALCLIWLSFLRSSQSTLCIVVLGLGNAIATFGSVGSGVNHLDLSPRFSGIVFGIMNAIGMGVSIIGPLTANWIVTDTTNASQWQYVFLIAAAFLIAGGIIYFFFSSASRQSWDGVENPKLTNKMKKISVVSFLSI